MKALLQLKDIHGLRATDFATQLWQQCAFQRETLRTLRFRRPDICQAFAAATDHGPPSGDSFIQSWASASRKDIAIAFERLAADGLRWGGYLGNNLNGPLNQICEHSLHAIMCFDLLLAARDSEYNPNASVKEVTMGTVDLADLLTGVVIPDIESLTKEKFGACPNIHVAAPEDNTLSKIDLCVPSLLVFTFVELLKNSIESVLVRHGPLNLEDAESGMCMSFVCSQSQTAHSTEYLIAFFLIDGPLVSFLLNPTPGDTKLGQIVLRDSGVGFGRSQTSDQLGISNEQNPFDAFYSTSPNRTREPSYHYSRTFGVPYSGAGIGLLKSKVSHLLWQ